MTPIEKIHWAAKVEPRTILRVYEGEASGLLDDALVDDLGIRLLLRCQSVLRAMAGEVECPRCGIVFSVAGRTTAGAGEAACPGGCGWATTRDRYLESKRHRHLNGADSILLVFGKFVTDYPNCRTPREKLLRIDRLIHEFHWDAKLRLPNRSVANNLIEGTHVQVIAFLDDLSAVDPERKARWRATVETMWKRRRGGMDGHCGPKTRYAHQEDFISLVAFWKRFMAEERTAVPDANPAEAEQPWSSRLRTLLADSKVLLVERTGAIAGFLAFLDDRDCAWVPPGVAYVVDIYVAPESRSSQAAIRLFRTARELIESRYDRIWTNTHRDNHRMQVLLQRAGFEPLDGFQIRGLRDQLYYQFAIAPSRT